MTGLHHALGVVLLVLYLLVGAAFAVGIVAERHVPPVTSASHEIQGEKGELGYAGATGQIGDVGLTGPTGTWIRDAIPLHGYTGCTGVTGIDSQFGATGFVGPTGSIGPDTGATGIGGAFGPTPLIGFTGATGGIGPRGATGATGFQTPGIVFAYALYNYSGLVTTSGSETIPLSAMTFVRTLPSSGVPPEITMTGSGGTIQFNQANAVYSVRIGLNLTLSGLPASTWTPATIVLQGFPAPSTMPAITLYPTPISATSACVSLGSLHVYRVPSPAPVVFAPTVIINLNDISAGATGVSISILSVTLERLQ